MIKLDEDALICDLAETYNIYDYRQLPLIRVAVFSYGLKDNSRIKLLLADQSADHQTLLLASMVDRLSFLVWSKTKDGQKGTNRPVSIVDSLMGKEQVKHQQAFNSGEEFEKARRQLLGKESD